MIEGAFVRGGVSSESLGDFAIVYLAIYEIQEYGALLGVGVELFMNSLAHNM